MTKDQLGRYLKRIGYNGLVEPTAQVLCDLQECHYMSVPYENLDMLSGTFYPLDEISLFEKVVKNQRGGYCFELNALFRHLLEAIGFKVASYFGRFVLGATDIPKRRHHILRVSTPEVDYVGDVGVGVSVPLRSLKLVENDIQEQDSGTYRFIKDKFLGWVMQQLHHGKWRSIFSFTEEKQVWVDFDAIHYFCVYSADSIYNRKLMLTLVHPEGRNTMDGLEYKQFRGSNVNVKTLTNQDELRKALDEGFGIRLSYVDEQRLFARVFLPNA